MGLVLSQLYDLFESLGTVSARVLMLGLDNAGKTTILYKVMLNETVTTIPTIGFNVETVEPVEGVSFTVWDLGGQNNIRPLWKRYFDNTEGLIYVVDSSDHKRMADSSEALHDILSDDSMQQVPVVIIANKQDLPGAMSLSEIVNRMSLKRITNPWHLQGTCASQGDGIYDAMDALSRLVKEFKQRNGEMLIDF